MNSKQPVIFLSSPPLFRFLFCTYVIFLTCTIISASYSVTNKTDHEALLNIKSMITQDPYGVLTSWNSSLRLCDWTGVTCGKRHKRVTYLRLQSQSLEGYLSPHVGNLSFLRELNLGNNSLQGSIPRELGRLSRLRTLYLYQNKFNGSIPTNISGCSNLENIDIAANELVGSIPKEISYLSQLRFLSLKMNYLIGGISPFLGNLTSIEVFILTDNPLGGSIPNTIGDMKNLKKISFGICNLYGTIPYSLYNLSLLTSISLAVNQITGSLPSTMGMMLPNLVKVQFMSNQLNGALPPSISNCSRLKYLEFINNSFSGKVTIDFSKLRDISFLTLGLNNFGSKDQDEMKFIDSLKNCTKLRMLHLGNCSFKGVLPRSIGNLSSQLQYLYLYGNQLHGSIPSSIGNLFGLQMLSLDDNQFKGSIPSTIGNLHKLEIVLLGENELSGHIPNAIGNLSMLNTLFLGNNILEGHIPSSLGNCRRLLFFSLDNNKLNGKIPKQLFHLSSLSIVLDLSYNHLTGSLPLEVGYLTLLGVLDLSENNLSGEIPNSLSGCSSLSSLSLKGNLFQGMIPPSLSSLKALVDLDISSNNFSGQIPKFLERLQYLNLSYNDFEGVVPVVGVFANVTAFSILGNSRLCGGLLELGLPKCKETKKHKKMFPLFVLAILIASTLFTITCLSFVWCKKKRKSQRSELSTLDQGFMKVSYSQLLKATNGFSESNLIGKGGFGSVYKGILNGDDDQYVAVKVLHLQNQRAQRSFMRECEAWRNIRHRNLLKIITACSSVDFQGNDFKALIYEFMPNGSLHDWLHLSESTSRLNLLQIISILMDIACVLDYLHNHSLPAVVHGDLKPRNILLDDDMVARVGDFGLARFLGTSYPNSSTGIRGTIGYTPPEYGLGSEMTCSGDVYSFGILLLEMMTRKKPSDDLFNESLSLHKYASMALPDNVIDVIDVDILNFYQEDENFMKNKEANTTKIEECLVATVKIGVLCSMDSPAERMDMKNIVNELKHILDTLQNN